MRIAIIGSRDFNDFYAMKWFITSMIQVNRNDIIISGGAEGADTLAEKFAELYHLKTQIYYADWNKYGKQAGPMRNHDIIANADICFAFKTHEDSKGTNHSIQLANDKGIPCHVYKKY